MSITVATVALNAADDLPITLESVVAQDFEDLEILLVDGGSWDDTAEVLERYDGAVHRVEVIEDAGIYDAMNRTAALASKDYILFLNAGDRFHTANALTKLWARRREGADVIFGNHIYRDKGVEAFRLASDFEAHLALLRSGDNLHLWLDRFPAHQATLTRTQLLREMRYDTALRICADHDFLLRAAHSGAQVQYVDEIVAIYTGGGFSARRHELCRLEWNAVYRRYCERPEKIDAFFFPEGSPFLGSRTPYTGEAVGGLYPHRPNDPTAPLTLPFRWAGGAGFRLLTPGHRQVNGLHLNGYNSVPHQVLEIRSGGTLLGRKSLSEGEFTFDLEFQSPVEPHTLVEVTAGSAVRLGESPRVVSVAIVHYYFMFMEEATPRMPGERITFGRIGRETGHDLLVSGWHDVEGTHVWSKEVGLLRISTRGPVEQLRFTLRANPVTERRQRLSVRVNDTEVAEVALGAGGDEEIVVPVGRVWRIGAGSNQVALVPSVATTAGNDPRQLGIALVALELV